MSRKIIYRDGFKNKEKPLNRTFKGVSFYKDLNYFIVRALNLLI